MQCIKDTIKNINIVIGCNIGCSYCYARMNNNRFHTIDDFNKPVFFENKLKMLDNKRHTAYLLTGQSDLSGWNEEWKDKVFSKMKENENTQYIFLTKRPENINLKETPDNGWFGVTVTSSKEKTRIDYLRNNIKAKHYHITFEDHALEGDADCGGLIAYNYISGEPVTGLAEGRPMFVFKLCHFV